MSTPNEKKYHTMWLVGIRDGNWIKTDLCHRNTNIAALFKRVADVAVVVVLPLLLFLCWLGIHIYKKHSGGEMKLGSISLHLVTKCQHLMQIHSSSR